MFPSAHPASPGGAARDRHGRWRQDAMDVRVCSAHVRADESSFTDEQKRVVLIPRRWDQVLRRRFARRRWLQSPVHRGERAISRKTIAQGMPVAPALPVVTAACLLCCRRAMGAACTRHSLRPPFSRGSRKLHHPGPCPAAGMRSCALLLSDIRSGTREAARLTIDCWAGGRNLISARSNVFALPLALFA